MSSQRCWMELTQCLLGLKVQAATLYAATGSAASSTMHAYMHPAMWNVRTLVNQGVPVPSACPIYTDCWLTVANSCKNMCACDVAMDACETHQVSHPDAHQHHACMPR